MSHEPADDAPHTRFEDEEWWQLGALVDYAFRSVDEQIRQLTLRFESRQLSLCASPIGTLLLRSAAPVTEVVEPLRGEELALLDRVRGLGVCWVWQLLSAPQHMVGLQLEFVASEPNRRTALILQIMAHPGTLSLTPIESLHE